MVGVAALYFVLIGVVIAGVSFKYPMVAVGVLVLTALFDQRRELIEGFAPMQSEVIALILAAPLANVWLRQRVLPKWMIVAASMLFLGAGLSLSVAVNPPAAWGALARWILVLNLMFAVAALCIRDSRARVVLASMVSGGGLLAGYFGEMQRSGNYFIVGPPYGSDVFDSTFGYYSNFANFEAIATIISLGLLTSGELRSRAAKIAIFLCFSMSLYSTVMSTSRGAIITIAIGIALTLLRYITRPVRFVLVAFASTAVLGVAWVLLQDTAIARVVQRFTVVQGGDVVRSSLQEFGQSLALARPLGIGFDGFRALAAQGPSGVIQALSHAHNSFIQMTLDGGWIGGLGFVILIVGASLGWLGRGQWLRSAFAAAVIGNAFQLTQDYFFFETASLIFFLLAVAGAASPRVSTFSASATAGVRSEPAARRPVDSGRILVEA